MLRPALLSLFAVSAFAQDLLPKPVVLQPEGKWSDFPALATDGGGVPHVAFVQWDGEKDALKVAKLTDGALSEVLTIGEPGIIHQPSMATDRKGVLHVFWSQVNEKDLMELRWTQIRDGKAEVGSLATSPNGGNAFAKAATSPSGDVWCVWQGMRGTTADVFCRFFDVERGKWSREIQVTNDAAGDWEPCVAFAGGKAWVVFDSARGNEFNIYATPIGDDLRAGEAKQLIATDHYEGRVSAIGSKDGKGLWISCERGNQQWGLDMRAHGHAQGLNGRKDTVFAYFDIESGKVNELPAPDGLFADLPGPQPGKAAAPRGNNPKAKAKAEQQAKARAAKDKEVGRAGPNQVAALNLPHVMLDVAGRPWLTVRYFKNYAWRIALTRYDEATKQWTKPFAIPGSVYSQDHQTTHALGSDGSLWIAWPSDLRSSKLQLNTGIHLAKVAKVATDADVPLVAAPAVKPREPFPAYINPVTPERDRGERHTWTHDGVTYKLYWGDYHRHTDFSNCITGNDGCILEQFRYAIDMGKLDTLGTSDHTDIAKIYTPYEWWLNQKLVDVFYAPGFFTSMYAYEREQKWPYGHRNMVFAQRGGPIVYIQRKNYLASPWQKLFPVKEDGEAELHPTELWSVLTRYGKPVTAISHTGATGMGTDWDQIPPIDHRVENVIEIYQGARVSYEAPGAPQPTVGLREGEKYNHSSDVVGVPVVGEPIRSFTVKNNGVYQHALEIGHKLGVWANSDHISTHTSYGGVYVKEFTREGIIEGLNARRTIAATDKIFVEFTCNDKLLGTEIELTGKPVLKFAIDGTAPITRVTLVRNEKNHQQWEPNAKTFTQTFTDESPLPGENRYYLRVEQTDGNMAWSSPVWVQVK